MFQKKNRIFAYLRQNIDSFFDYLQTGVIPNRKEFKEPFDICLERYKELTEDPEFLSKVQELAYLETILIQAKCASNVSPSFYKQPNKFPLIYARSSYPSLRKNYNNVTVSMGQASRQNKTLNQLSNDPLFLNTAQNKILKNMRKDFHYEEYNLKYRRTDV